MSESPFSIIALAGLGVAALWVWNQSAERTKKGSAENPVTDSYYVNPLLCALFGTFCYEESSAGTTSPVRETSPYPSEWTETPTVYWYQARLSGMTLEEACRARAPTGMQYDLCMLSGW